MSLKDKINSDLKEAMKAGDKVRLSTVRSIRALILDFEKSGANRELTPEEEMSLTGLMYPVGVSALMVISGREKVFLFSSARERDEYIRSIIFKSNRYFIRITPKE